MRILSFIAKSGPLLHLVDQVNQELCDVFYQITELKWTSCSIVLAKCWQTHHISKPPTSATTSTILDLPILVYVRSAAVYRE
jgi:hypothetical protein